MITHTNFILSIRCAWPQQAPEVAADALDEEWKDYVVWISVGDKKQGLTTKQAVSYRWLSGRAIE